MSSNCEYYRVYHGLFGSLVVKADTPKKAIDTVYRAYGVEAFVAEPLENYSGACLS